MANQVKLIFWSVMPERPECRYCDGSGWFYSMPELGCCGCREINDLECEAGENCCRVVEQKHHQPAIQ